MSWSEGPVTAARPHAAVGASEEACRAGWLWGRAGGWGLGKEDGLEPTSVPPSSKPGDMDRQQGGRTTPPRSCLHPAQDSALTREMPQLEPETLRAPWLPQAARRPATCVSRSGAQRATPACRVCWQLLAFRLPDCSQLPLVATQSHPGKGIWGDVIPALLS